MPKPIHTPITNTTSQWPTQHFTLGTFPLPTTRRTRMTTYRQRLDAGDYTQGTQGTTLKRDAIVCPECGKKLTSEHGLKIHRTKAHGANGETPATDQTTTDDSSDATDTDDF